MLPDRVSNPGPLTYESGALPIALRGPARNLYNSLNSIKENIFVVYGVEENVLGGECPSLVETCLSSVCLNFWGLPTLKKLDPATAYTLFFSYKILYSNESILLTELISLLLLIFVPEVMQVLAFFDEVAVRWFA